MDDFVQVPRFLENIPLTAPRQMPLWHLGPRSPNATPKRLEKASKIMKTYGTYETYGTLPNYIGG